MDVDGVLTTGRGTYRLPIGPATREFSVTRGEVRYFGTPDFNAALDIEAAGELRALLAEVWAGAEEEARRPHPAAATTA